MTDTPLWEDNAEAEFWWLRTVDDEGNVGNYIESGPCGCTGTTKAAAVRKARRWEKTHKFVRKVTLMHKDDEIKVLFER